MNEVEVPEISDEELETYLARKAPGTNVRTAISFPPTYSNIQLIPIESIGIPPNRQGDPPRDRIHQSQKNEAVVEHFLSMLVTPTTRILDPTCGSGVAIRVAKRLGAEAGLGLELDKDFVLLAQDAPAKEHREVIGGLPIPADKLPTAYLRADRLLRFPRALFNEAAE